VLLWRWQPHVLLKLQAVLLMVLLLLLLLLLGLKCRWWLLHVLLWQNQMWWHCRQLGQLVSSMLEGHGCPWGLLC
jgi:hypothetical protein